MADAAAPPARWRSVAGDGERLLLAIVAAYILAFCALPLGRLFAEAFVLLDEGGWAAVADILTSRGTRRATWHTIEAGLASTVVSLVLGTAMALLVSLTDIRFKTALIFLLILPILIPAQISAIAWLQLLSPTSAVLGVLGLAPEAGTRNPLYSREGIVLLMGIEHSTMVFLAVRAGLRALPTDMVEAARAAGAGPLRVTSTIVLPMLRPAMVAGAALAFVAAIGNFGIPALLGIPGRYTMLTTLVYQRLNGFGPSVLGEVAVLAFILAALAAFGLLVQSLAQRGSGFRIERSGATGTVFALGPWRPVVELTAWTVLTVIAILPLVALVTASLIPAVGVPLTADTATLDSYRFIFSHDASRRAFVNSFLLAGGAALACVAISVPLAYLLINRGGRLVHVLNVVADAPFALPGIVLSIACILVFLRPLPILEVSLYGTFWILLVAYLGRFLTLGLRPTISGFQQVDPALEEAAQIAGVGTVRRLATILLPLVAPAAAAGGLLIFMSAFNELTVSALIWSTGNETLGVVVFNLYDEGNSTGAAAIAVLSVVATLALAGLVSLWSHRLPRGVLPWQA